MGDRVARVPGGGRDGDGVPRHGRGRRRPKPWLDRAAAVASEHPTPLRARRLETWRGLARRQPATPPGCGSTSSARSSSPPRRGCPAARCEALARPGAGGRAPRGRARGRRPARARRALGRRRPRDSRAELPGHPPWAAQAEAALAQVELARGRADEAADRARAAVASLESRAMHEDRYLDVLCRWRTRCWRAVPPSGRASAANLQLTLAMIAQRTMDEDVRVRWFRGPIGQRADTAGRADRVRPQRRGRQRTRTAGADGRPTHSCSGAWCRADQPRDRRERSASTSRRSRDGSASCSPGSARPRARRPPRSPSARGSYEGDERWR